MNDFNYNSNDNRGRQSDLVLPANEYAFVLNKSTGVIQTYVGPRVVTVSQQEALVLFDAKSKKFIETNDYNRAKQLFTSAPEGWYVVLKNPTDSGKHPEAGAISHTPTDMHVGIKVNIPGPTSFALFPGQMAKVIRGHKLRSNQYLLARVYDADAAMKSLNTAVVLDAEGNAKDNSKDTYFAGQQLVIKGTEISFYIPPTGIEVLACENNPSEFVRDAVTLERLEYAILKDESGEKSYQHGPAVVFPKPTETFVAAPKGGVIFRALELSPISGIYVKVIAEYSDKNKEGETIVHPVGEELFITGNDQMIYYPRPEHAMIQYDGKYMHHAIAIPEGEGRYILDRLSGKVKTIKGPCMYLPDPRTEVVLKRKLTAKECELYYPGNREVLEYNLGLSEQAMEKRARNGQANMTDRINNAYSTSNQETALAIFEANANISRGVSYTKPRTITLDTKYDGVVTIDVWTGYAVNVVSKSGKRETIVGPATRLLDYDETLEAVTLSTGKPKTNNKVINTAYLRVDNNKVSDIITVQTNDFVDVSIQVSYCVNFLPEHRSKWFSVDNYVQYLCERQRSLLKREAKEYDIEEFYAHAADIVRKVVLDIKDETKDENTNTTEKEANKPHCGRYFPENGMVVTDVEVLNVMVEPKIAQLMEQHQNEMIKKTLELSMATKRMKTIEQLADYNKKETKLNHEARMYQLNLEHKANEEKMANQAAIAELKREETAAEATAKKDMQTVLDAIHTAQLKRDKAADDAKIATEKALADVEKAKQAAYAETVAKIMASIQPGLIEALNAKSEIELAQGIATAVSPYSMANNESVAETVHKLLKGTSIDEAIKNIGAYKTEE